MMWDRVSVLYADDDYSLAISKSINLKAVESGICFEGYADISKVGTALPASNGTAAAVFVVSPPEDAAEATKRMLNATGGKQKIQWLFAQPWSAERTDLLEELTKSSDVYGLALSPVNVEPFEAYWSLRKNPQLATFPENLWFLEYYARMKKCRLPGITIDPQWMPCHNFNVPETALDRLLRHTRVLPAVHVLNTFAHAFRRSRDSKCGSKEPGYCAQLRAMTRKDFLDAFESLQVQHGGPGNRVPTGFVGSRRSADHKIYDAKFSLIRSVQGGDRVKELFSFHKAGGVKTIDRSIPLSPTQCPPSGCMNCAFMQGGIYSSLTPSPVAEDGPRPPLDPGQQSGTAAGGSVSGQVTQHLDGDDGDDGDLNRAESIASVLKPASLTNHSSAGLNILPDTAMNKERRVNSSSSPGRLKITDIIVPALFGVHKAGPTPLQCSAQVNSEAIQDIEAFLWALDLINRNVALLKGIEIGAVIFDTCSSSIKAAHLVSSILAKEGDPMLEEISIDPEQLLAVVSATAGDETEAAASVLSSHLITTVSAKERSDSRLATSHQLQVAVPMSVAARAVIDLLSYSGWTYVSVIYSSHDVDSVAGFRHFQQLAENTQICIALAEKLNQTSSAASSKSLDRVFENLASKLDMGSRVVVLWTDEADTQSILSKMHLLSPEIAERYKQLVWISAAGWINGGRVTNMVKDVGKWLAVRPQVKTVPEFAEHFARLRPDNNERNPWFAEYWEQINGQCSEQSSSSTAINQQEQCPGAMRIHPSTTTVIQAVYVFASGLARLIEDYCPDQQLNSQGICSTNDTTFRETLLGYFQNTGTDRPGETGGEFGFTDMGYGDTQLEIVEVRGGFSEFTFHPVGIYDQDVLSIASAESGSDGLLSVVSECSANSRKEVCAGCVAKQQNQMLIKGSKDRLYVMGLFDVRDKNADGPWSCSTNVTSRGIQQTEAFLWALDRVNNHMPHLLPGVQLGAIGLDGCGTQEKRTAEIGRVFSSAAIQSGIGENQILGMVVGADDADPRILYELHHRHHLPVVLSAPGLEVPGTAPLFQLSPSIPVMARVLSDVLGLMNWTYVSSVCSNQMPYNAICEEFQNFASHNDVTFAVDLAVNEHPHALNYWENVASMVATKALNGARVLIALLPDNQLLDLLVALRKLPAVNQQSIVLVTASADGRVEEEALVLAGHVQLRHKLPSADAFFAHFNTMKFQLASPNPWLMKYWTQQFECRGAACQQLDLHQTFYQKDETAANIINGVLAIAHGLERVRQELCPDFAQGICPAMAAHDIRRKVERAIMDHPFVDLNGKSVDFSRITGVSQDAAVEIINSFASQSSSSSTAERIVSGTFSLRHQLVLDPSKLRVRDGNATVSMETISSKCLTCQPKSPARPQWYPSQYMQVQPESKPGFSLVGLLPFHRQGLKPLSCGTMHSGRMFQNLAAVAMTLDRLRTNGSVPQSLQVGAVFFDTCGRVERAQQRLLSFVSDSSAPLWTSSIIGALTLDGETAQAVSNVLGDANIPQFTTAIDGYRSPSSSAPYTAGKEPGWHSLGGPRIMQTVPSTEDEVKAMFDVVHQLAWKHVVVFYDDSQAGASDRDLFLQQIQQAEGSAGGSGICVGAQIRVNKFGQGDIVDLHSLLEAVASDLPALSVAVLLLDSPAQVQHVLLVLEDVRLAQKFIVVANHAWGNHRDVLFEASTRHLAGVLTVSMETYPVQGFNRFLADMTLESHSTIPDDWFEEYFQHHFECHLLGSKTIQRMYPKQCSGTERFDVVEQDPYVYHTVAAVETFVKALHEFLQLYCPAGMDATQLSDCGPNSLERFNAVVNDLVKREPYKLLSSSTEPSVRGYRGVVVWNGQHYADKPVHYERVGFWRQNRLELDRTRMKFYVPYAAVPSVECLQGPCLSVCSVKLSTLLATQRTPTPSFPSSGKIIPEVPTNFATAWGVVAVVFCILGLLCCMACVSYFVRNIPKPSPTTVLSYFVLAGVALLYIATVFFLIQPSSVSCGLRRFFLGLAYSIIFSGMLVRCIHVWRRMSRGESRPSAFASSNSSTRSFDLTDTTKPPGLVFTTMTLVAVQVILLSAWLIFKPPFAVPSPSPQQPGMWRCAPADNFESELVISLVLPIVLLFTATLFSLVVWRSSDAPRDSRSTTACCAILAFFIVIWTLVATQASFPFRYYFGLFIVFNYFTFRPC